MTHGVILNEMMKFVIITAKLEQLKHKFPSEKIFLFFSKTKTIIQHCSNIVRKMN